MNKMRPHRYSFLPFPVRGVLAEGETGILVIGINNKIPCGDPKDLSKFLRSNTLLSSVAVP
jgi:hypothetical protein